MATTWDDVVTLARELPAVEEATWFGTPSLKVAGKGFARLRSEAEGGVRGCRGFSGDLVALSATHEAQNRFTNAE
jgi:hypothetical protein